MVFEKPSTRTRLSFEVGIASSARTPSSSTPRTTQLGRGETIEDTARVLSRYVDAIVIRTFGQEPHRGARRARAACPVVNALTDGYHPCQVLADLQTVPRAPRAARGPDARLPRRRREQHGPQLPGRRGDGRHARADRRARGLPARPRGRRAGPGARHATCVVTADPRRGGRGRRRAVHRRVGLDGPGAAREQRRRDLAPYALDEARRRRRRRRRWCCTACPRTAARRSRPRSSTARGRPSGTRPRTGCTRRRRC